MSFYPARSLRLAAAATLIALLAALTLLAIPQVAGAAPKCQAPKQTWKVNGRTLCLRTAKAAAGHAAAEPKARLARWLRAVGIPKAAKSKLPAKLRKFEPKVAVVGAKLLARTSSLGNAAGAAGAHSRRGLLAAVATTGGPVVDSVSVDGPGMKLEGGATISSHIVAREFADGSRDINLTVELNVEGYTLSYQPTIHTGKTTIPDVDCPTSAGLLKIDYTSSDGGTLIARKGRNVLGAVTQKFSDTIHARGHVGRDAKLQDVSVDVTSKLENYQRGQQLVVNTAASFTVPREGHAVLTSSPSADVKIRYAGATAADERAWEKVVAENTAAAKSTADSLASGADLARWSMMQNEYKWYSIPNSCAQINFDPGVLNKLAAGKSMNVSGVVNGQDGGEAAASFTVQHVGRGSFSATKSQSDPGSPAQFTATAAAPDSDRLTVASESIATSTAGRAQTGWYASDDLDLPKKLSGTISASTSGPGGSSYFHAWAVYTLENVYVNDSGYISAFYKLTTAEMDEAENNIGVGCRWVGKGSGGSIADGDIELRKAPGGKWQHAVMYDVEIPDVTYVATDCGAAPMPPFQGELVGFVNMAMLGGGFEPVGDDFHLDAVRSYTDPASQRKTVGSWGFEPGEFE